VKRLLKRLLLWIAFTVVLAACFHVAWFCYLPRLVTSRVVNQIHETRPGMQVNVLGHAPLRYAETDVVVRDNPDTLTSFAVYDVSEHPLRIHCVIPNTDDYWSLSLFAWNTDNFFVVNDRSAPADIFNVIVVRPNSLYQELADEQVVVAPSERGVLIVRVVVPDRHDTKELELIAEVQRQTYIEPLDGVIY
jgi:uncharacterized membrane protein